MIIEKISTIDKNAENWYYLVKWTSGSYTLPYYHSMGENVTKAGYLVYDSFYLNPFANFRQCYTPYENNEGKKLSGWILLF